MSLRSCPLLLRVGSEAVVVGVEDSSPLLLLLLEALEAVPLVNNVE